MSKFHTTVCPDCGSKCNTLKTNQLSPLCREITYICSNDDCEHIFVAQIVPVRTISRSSRPNPETALPMAAGA